MKMRALIAMLAASTMLDAHSDQQLVSRKDFNCSPLWAIQSIQGKPFWTILSCRFAAQGRYWQGVLLPGTYRPVEQEAPFISSLSGLPIFQNSGISVEPSFRENTDFTALDKYNCGEVFRVSEMLGAEETLAADASVKKGTPLIIRDWAPRPFPMKMTSDTYQYDKAEYEQWLKDHPNFLTFDMGEWDNEYINLEYYLKVYQDINKVSAEKAKKISEDFPRVNTRDEMVARLKKAFERKKALYFGDAERMSFMNAGWNLEHLAAYLGAGMITLETSNSGGGETYYRWQVGMSFARGASRQYSIPWMWYIASCLNGYTSKGDWVSSYEPGFDSDNGVGPSWLNRCFYLAYFGGANLMELEHWYLKILAISRENPKDYRYSRIGKHFTTFCEFASANPERGVPYTPIALLVPFNQCYPQWGGCTVPPYTRGDFTLDAFWATIIPAYDRTPALKRGEQGALFNSPYGDLFDVVVPDAPKARNFKEALAAYKVAILTGDIKPSLELRQLLEDYVRTGGTLVANVKQLDLLFPSELAGIRREKRDIALPECDEYTIEAVNLEGAVAVEASADGHSVMTVNKCGKGNVVVSMIDGWVPRLTPQSESQTRRGLITFPFIQSLLKKLTAETTPFRVDGEVQYGINKTSSGYIVYLINNRGVTKMADTPEVVDETALAPVNISWRGFTVDRVTEMRSGKEIQMRDGSIAVTVPPGDVIALRFVCQSQ